MSELAIKGGEPVRTKPFPRWPVFDEREGDAIREVLHSGVWGIGGTKKKEFEEKFAAYQDARYGVAVTNGTAALETALRAAGISTGDEVIMPAYTFMATATAVLHVGGLPVFADIEPDTYTLDPEKVEAAITGKTRAVLPVHIGGRPANMDEMVRIAQKNNLLIIEDACQAWGAEWRNGKVGAIGDLGTFSFQSSKNITSGEGGIVVTNDRRLYELCWSYHNCGRVMNGEWYRHDVPGTNCRMTEFQAAILLVQLTRLEEHTKTRNKNATYLSEKMSKIDGVEPLRQDPRVTNHAYHLFTFRYDAEGFDGLPRNEFVEALRAEGIPCSPGYRPLYKEAFMLNLANDRFLSREYGERADYNRVQLPVTEKACYEEAVWFFQSMLLGTREDMNDIIDAILKIKENVNALTL